MMRRPTLTVSLNLRDRPVLLVGDGPGADERASRLQDAGAALRRVAAGDYQTDMCDQVFLVVAQTDDRPLDRRIAADARSRGCLAYAHDQPDTSDFAFPALSRRGPLSVLFATDGVAPALSRRLREQFDRLLESAGPALDALIDELARERAAQSPGPDRARDLYRRASRLFIRGQLVIDDDE